ncbi:MAG: BREX system Lon protease-like protein BrxL [Peptococcaceae bacterium]|jgi:ATP-dependent Lon protease|nr:BREX system Lon protease-like protein BrxL [Peptococcaceae bacterium]
MHPEQVARLREKARMVFGPALAEDAGLSAPWAGGTLPRFLVDFLSGQYGPAAEELVLHHYPTGRTRQIMRNRLLQDGELVLLDYVEVTVDLDRGEPVARLAALDVNQAAVMPGLLDTYPDLLQGGLWGKVTVHYDTEAARRRGDGLSPVVIGDFEALQATVDLPHFVAARREFSTVEWIELLLRSAGYDPGAVCGPGEGERLRWLYLARLLPLVERNLNLMELGPKNTGKTFLLRNLSPRAFSLAGGRATPANLFINLVTGAVGLVASRQVVIFDEIAYTSFTDELGTVSLLKDFMESGRFSRGRSAHSAETSLVFLGNLRVEGRQPAGGYAHLFEPLPRELQDTALLDRLHAYIPGWEFPKLTPAAINPGFGLSTDYFGEILLALRDLAYGTHWQEITERYPLRDGMTRRDQAAVERVGRAFTKLVFPDGRITEPETRQILEVAGELRQRVENQLEVMEPGEFYPHEVGFLPSKGRTVWALPGDFVARQAAGALDRRLNLGPAAGEVTALTMLADKGRVMGGGVQIIQAVAIDGGSGQIKLTGQHGSELEQALQTAYHYLQKQAPELGLDYIKSKNIAVHLVTQGYGRGSPGLALVLAIVSALLDRPVRPACAAVGGVSLHGDIGPVEGLPQMVMAAHRRGRRFLLIPRENGRDLAAGAVPERILRELRIEAVATVREALEKAFASPGDGGS